MNKETAINIAAYFADKILEILLGISIEQSLGKLEKKLFWKGVISKFIIDFCGYYSDFQQSEQDEVLAIDGEFFSTEEVSELLVQGFLGGVFDRKELLDLYRTKYGNGNLDVLEKNLNDAIQVFEVTIKKKLPHAQLLVYKNLKGTINTRLNIIEEILTKQPEEIENLITQRDGKSESEKFKKNLANLERHTERSIRHIRRNILGISRIIDRFEITQIESFLSQGKRVILVGEAGTGKSGIGLSLLETENILPRKLYIDARRLAKLQNETNIRDYFGLNESIHDVIRTIGSRVSVVRAFGN